MSLTDPTCLVGSPSRFCEHRVETDDVVSCDTIYIGRTVSHSVWLKFVGHSSFNTWYTFDVCGLSDEGKILFQKPLVSSTGHWVTRRQIAKTTGNFGTLFVQDFDGAFVLMDVCLETGESFVLQRTFATLPTFSPEARWLAWFLPGGKTVCRRPLRNTHRADVSAGLQRTQVPSWSYGDRLGIGDSGDLWIYNTAGAGKNGHFWRRGESSEMEVVETKSFPFFEFPDLLLPGPSGSWLALPPDEFGFDGYLEYDSERHETHPWAVYNSRADPNDGLPPEVAHHVFGRAKLLPQNKRMSYGHRAYAVAAFGLGWIDDPNVDERDLIVEEIRVEIRGAVDCVVLNTSSHTWIAPIARASSSLRNTCLLALARISFPSERLPDDECRAICSGFVDWLRRSCRPSIEQ